MEYKGRITENGMCINAGLSDGIKIGDLMLLKRKENKNNKNKNPGFYCNAEVIAIFNDCSIIKIIQKTLDMWVTSIPDEFVAIPLCKKGTPSKTGILVYEGWINNDILEINANLADPINMGDVFLIFDLRDSSEIYCHAEVIGRQSPGIIHLKQLPDTRSWGKRIPDRFMAKLIARSVIEKETEVKLFEVNYQDDCEFETILKVGKSAKEVYDAFSEYDIEHLSCHMGHTVREIKSVDGYKILLQPSDEEDEYGEKYPTDEMYEKAEKERNGRLIAEIYNEAYRED